MLLSATQSFIGFFVFGFAGSLHCIGMCGPLAVCARTPDCSRKINHGLLIYFVVRLITYSVLGLIAGYMGQLLFMRQMQTDSLVLWWMFVGLMLAFAVHEIFYGYRVWRGTAGKSLHVVSSAAESKQSRLALMFGVLNKKFLTVSQSLNDAILQSSRLPRSVALGLATALLPCGFLAMALMQAAALAHPVDALAGLSGFALGTTPALWGGAALTLFVRRIAPRAARLVVGLLFFLGALGLTMRTSKISTSQAIEQPSGSGTSSGQERAKLPCH